MAIATLLVLAACTPGQPPPTEETPRSSTVVADPAAVQGLGSLAAVEGLADLPCETLRAQVRFNPLVEGAEAARCLSVSADGPQAAVEAVSSWLAAGTGFTPVTTDSAPAGLGAAQLESGTSRLVVRTVPAGLRTDPTAPGVLVTVELLTEAAADAPR